MVRRGQKNKIKLSLPKVLTLSLKRFCNRTDFQNFKSSDKINVVWGGTSVRRSAPMHASPVRSLCWSVNLISAGKLPILFFKTMLQSRGCGTAAPISLAGWGLWAEEHPQHGKAPKHRKPHLAAEKGTQQAPSLLDTTALMGGWLHSGLASQAEHHHDSINVFFFAILKL